MALEFFLIKTRTKLKRENLEKLGLQMLSYSNHVTIIPSISTLQKVKSEVELNSSYVIAAIPLYISAI